MINLILVYDAGTVWTASAHIITAVISTGILSLAWSVAQLGWIFGISIVLIFAAITLYTANLLADCYRCPDPVIGKRNYTYMEAVQNILGNFKAYTKNCKINTYSFTV